MKTVTLNLSDHYSEELARLLKVLGNPLRLKILALCLTKERTSRELREKLGISKPLLIANIRKLVNAGLLEYRVEIDKERMIIRKYYSTKKGLSICLNEEVLEKVAKKLE